MSTPDYSWDKDSPLNDERLQSSVVPTRYALTAPQVVVNEHKQILLVDPHAPGTWDSWMFPYASLILERDRLVHGSGTTAADHPVLDITAGSSFRELSAALEALRTSHEHDYVQAIRTGVNNVVENLSGSWGGEVIYTNFSLKFSKTSNTYTAYEFSYHLTHVPALALEIPHHWIEPQRLSEHLRDSPAIEGRSVSSNVVDALPRLRTLV